MLLLGGMVLEWEGVGRMKSLISQGIVQMSLPEPSDTSKLYLQERRSLAEAHESFMLYWTRTNIS